MPHILLRGCSCQTAPGGPSSPHPLPRARVWPPARRTPRSLRAHSGRAVCAAVSPWGGAAAAVRGQPLPQMERRPRFLQGGPGVVFVLRRSRVQSVCHGEGSASATDPPCWSGCSHASLLFGAACEREAGVPSEAPRPVAMVDLVEARQRFRKRGLRAGPASGALTNSCLFPPQNSIPFEHHGK